MLGHVTQLERRRFFGFVAAGGQLDELVHEVGQLASLPVDVVEQACAGVRAEFGEPAQDAGVGAQAGQRGPQLVRGVLDEAFLVGAGVGEPAEHPVERRREAADFVVAAGRHGDVVEAAVADLLGHVGQPDQPPGDLPRQQPAGEGRPGQHQGADAGDARGQALQDVRGLVDVDAELDRAATGPECDGDHAVVVAAGGEVAVAVVAEGAGRGQQPILVADVEVHRPATDRADGAVRGDRLGHHRLGLVVVVVVRAAGERARREDLRRPGRDLGRRREQRSVELGVDPLGGGLVAEDADEDRRGRADPGEGDRELAAQVHAGRTE